MSQLVLQFCLFRSSVSLCEDVAELVGIQSAKQQLCTVLHHVGTEGVLCVRLVVCCTSTPKNDATELFTVRLFYFMGGGIFIFLY